MGRLFGAVALFGLLSGAFVACTGARPTVTVVNESPSPLTAVELNHNRTLLWKGDLAPGASASVPFKGGEGSFTLTGTLDNAPLPAASLGYTSDLDPKYTLRVLPDRTVVFAAGAASQQR